MRLFVEYKQVGKNQVIDKIIDQDTGKQIKPMFDHYQSKEDYIKAGVRYVVPMTAKEEDREEELEKMLLSNSGYYAEEKLDGTRATIHIGKHSTRVFSRRVSVKTGWFSENTDSLPHLRSIKSKKFHDTVLDSEMQIPDRPFKDVSSTLNCDWDTAIERQIELGLIVPHCFDIIYYKGIYVAKMPLWKRKKYVQKVLDGLKSEYLKVLQYSDDKLTVPFTRYINDHLADNGKYGWRELYPHLHEEIFKQGYFRCPPAMLVNAVVTLSKEAYYEYIVASGGEGIILKDKNGKYFHKRGREFTKLKKFLTRECIITNFLEPTREYKGENLKTWQYWEKDHNGHKSIYEGFYCGYAGYEAVTKFYAKDWVGNIQYAVLATDDEVLEWKRTNRCEPLIVGHIEGLHLLVVGDCSGFSEEIRAEFTKSKEQLIGQVVEIKANELFKNTGKMRHPRFLRLRPDKNAIDCTWDNHINC